MGAPRFNEHRVAARIREMRGLPPKDESKLTGKVAASKRIPLPEEHQVHARSKRLHGCMDEQHDLTHFPQAAVQRVWNLIATPRTGFATFEDMRAARKAELAERASQ